MRIGSLFSGAGGLDLAVEAVFGGHTVWHSEIDAAASKVLAYRYPHIPNLGDITTANWNAAPPVDIICGGFPCVDVSIAGQRAGLAAGTRSGLWHEMARIIGLHSPRYVIIENVRGLLSAAANRHLEPGNPTLGDGSDQPVLRAIGAVVGDLADLGYDAQWATVRASDVGAPHTRERVFVLATRGTSEVPCRTGWPLLPDVDQLLPTPTTQDGANNAGPSQFERNSLPLNALATQLDCGWGVYGEAIRRWEEISRPAPAPMHDRGDGKPVLNPAFSEWMMGWPKGWVTDPNIGISRNDQLRIVGNGVVSRQCEFALWYLLRIAEASR